MHANDLIRMAKAGESSAWRLLHEMHYPWLYSLALKHCHTLAEAQDAVQETFVSAFLKLHQLKDPAAFPAWLKTILLRQCMNGRATDTAFGCRDLIFHHLQDNLAEQAEEEFAKAKLNNVLAALPEVLRGVVLLRYFSDWHSYEQIAEILSIPVGTVRSRLNQAKAKLLQCWKNAPTHGDWQTYADEWNEFYTHHLSNLYFSLTCRDNFLDHLSKNIELCLPGTVARGRHLIEQEIEGDVAHGSYFRDVHVVGSGNISVVEVATQNSSAYPDRCPAQLVIVLFRDNGKADRLHLYRSR